MTLKQKTYKGQIKLKAASEAGEFEAIFATMNTKDHDGDVTLPGAFGSQPVIIEPWNHNYSELPVGRGQIDEQDNAAVVAGKFWLDTVGGLEHYKVVKELQDMQQWSYTFYILEAEFGKFNGEDVRFLKKLDVVGVGPVARGAGVGTRVLDLKRRKGQGETQDALDDEDERGEDPDESDEGEVQAETGLDKPSVVLAEIELEDLSEDLED